MRIHGLLLAEQDAEQALAVCTRRAVVTEVRVAWMQQAEAVAAQAVQERRAATRVACKKQAVDSAAHAACRKRVAGGGARESPA